MPDISTWRQFVKDNECNLLEPIIDIPQHKVGTLRVNQKFCFPCDNSIIRVDKHNVGGRRFGASVILKDNMVFGIREDESVVEEKVAGDDELFNLETKKASNRNCQFWLEFENKARLSIAMIEPVEAQKELIPPISNLDVKSNTKRAEIGTISQHDSIEHDGTISHAQEDAALASKMQKSSLAGGVIPEQSKDH